MSLTSLLPVIITFSGGWFVLMIGPSLFFHPAKLCFYMKKALSRKEAKKSLALALAGTLGVGNIVGVAVGISIGGAGCVPWLLISSVFSAVLKFSEVSLSAYTSVGGGLGMISVIHNSFSKFGSALSYIYAALCLLLSFFMGCALQISSVMESVKYEVDFLPSFLYSIIIICLFFLVYNSVKVIRSTHFACFAHMYLL